MKRFWKNTAAVADSGDRWRIELDGRPVRTPARALLLLPGEPLAQAVAGEWAAAGETVDPRAMPLTGLANAALDRIAPAHGAFADGLARYAASDLLCYRADSPAKTMSQARARLNPAPAAAPFTIAMTGFSSFIIVRITPPAWLMYR